jgi:hypothetical protein
VLSSLDDCWINTYTADYLDDQLAPTSTSDLDS